MATTNNSSANNKIPYADQHTPIKDNVQQGQDQQGEKWVTKIASDKHDVVQKGDDKMKR